jgi:hypothetical protein
MIPAPTFYFRRAALVAALCLCTAATDRPALRVEITPEIADLSGIAAHTIAGHIDKAAIGREIRLEGWGRLSAQADSKLIRLHTDLLIASVSAWAYERPDVVAVVKDSGLALSGFVVTIGLPEGATLPEKFTLCVTTKDAVYGSFRMHDNPAVPCRLPLSK